MHIEIETKVKNKLLIIIEKLENINIKEIECISQFLTELDKGDFKSELEVDDKIYTKLEFIRDNYNKILLNIQKMIANSTFLVELRNKFEKNKNSLELFNEVKNEKFKEKHEEPTTSKRDKSWLDNLYNDLDKLDKVTIKKTAKTANNSVVNTVHNDYPCGKN
jgi:hypothetical protein